MVEYYIFDVVWLFVCDFFCSNLRKNRAGRYCKEDLNGMVNERLVVHHKLLNQKKIIIFLCVLDILISSVGIIFTHTRNSNPKNRSDTFS